MFDSVLLISFGGPQGLDDIRPFLANVLRNRRVTPERVEEIARHYELFGGISPITQLTERQAEGLRQRLAAAGHPLPVYVGMRNWHPLLADTLREMHDAGARRAVGFIAAAHHCYSSCQQYRENVAGARETLRAATGADIDVTYAGSWFNHPLFIQAVSGRVRAALGRLPADVRDRARVVFTAHSIPTPMAESSRYREQLNESCEQVMVRLKADTPDADGVSGFSRTWALVYQSRSGRPGDPWLEPDIRDYLRTARADGLAAAVICPIGFVCDHIEVLYDLDHEAAAVCAEVGLPMARASAVNDDPLFLDMMADVVLQTLRRYGTGRPLPLSSQARATERQEQNRPS